MILYLLFIIIQLVYGSTWHNVQSFGKKLTCANVSGSFYNPDEHNKTLLVDLMGHIKDKRPFAWIRWGDGDIDGVSKLNSSHINWPQTPDLYVAVGTWWVCNNFLNKWNTQFGFDQIFDKNYTFVEYFYLPMGDPIDDGMADQVKYNISGWMIEAFRHNRKIIAVGPSYFRKLPFLSDYYPENNSDEDIAKFVNNQPAYSIIGICKGTHTKRIITNLFRNNTLNHTFIDIGRAWHLYSKQSAFGLKLSHACNKTHTEDIDTWFVKDACKDLPKISPEPITPPSEPITPSSEPITPPSEPITPPSEPIEDLKSLKNKLAFIRDNITSFQEDSMKFSRARLNIEKNNEHRLVVELNTTRHEYETAVLLQIRHEKILKKIPLNNIFIQEYKSKISKTLENFIDKMQKKQTDLKHRIQESKATQLLYYDRYVEYDIEFKIWKSIISLI